MEDACQRGWKSGFKAAQEPHVTADSMEKGYQLSMSSLNDMLPENEHFNVEEQKEYLKCRRNGARAFENLRGRDV